MKILGIETSCDETAAAVVADGRMLLSNVVESQIDIHKVYGGVVPEIAARSHVEVMVPVVETALAKASCRWDDIDAIAVTYAPGLSGSLLIGALTARTLSLLKNKPLLPVHHVEAHVYANFLSEHPPAFPLLALIVSGGHTQLVLFRGHGDYELLGQTQDDAVGEAFDKVAKILGLPYPGGPSIAEAAENGNPEAFRLPKARLQGAYDFSFSGLKTAVLRALQAHVGVDHNFPSWQLSSRLDAATRADMAASFQRAAIHALVEKTALAYRDHSPASLVIAGGVAANQELRRVMETHIGAGVSYPDISLCTDNAAMIAALGYYRLIGGDAAVDPREMGIAPSLSM